MLRLITEQNANEIEIIDDDTQVEIISDDTEKSAIEKLVKDLIKSEWNASDEYKSAIETLKTIKNKDIAENIIKVLTSISDEEITHVGELEAVLNSLNPQTEENISSGKDEANNHLDQN